MDAGDAAEMEALFTGLKKKKKKASATAGDDETPAATQEDDTAALFSADLKKKKKKKKPSETPAAAEDDEAAGAATPDATDGTSKGDSAGLNADGSAAKGDDSEEYVYQDVNILLSLFNDPHLTPYEIAPLAHLHSPPSK